MEGEGSEGGGACVGGGPLSPGLNPTSHPQNHVSSYCPLKAEQWRGTDPVPIGTSDTRQCGKYDTPVPLVQAHLSLTPRRLESVGPMAKTADRLGEHTQKNRNEKKPQPSKSKSQLGSRMAATCTCFIGKRLTKAYNNYRAPAAKPCDGQGQGRGVRVIATHC